MSFSKKFTFPMKNEFSNKSRFSWTLNEEKYLNLCDVRRLEKLCRKARDLALQDGRIVPVRDWIMIELGLNTGLRVQEMANLKCGDLHIHQEQSSLSVRYGKCNKPRTVRINEKFKNYCKWFLKWKLKHGQNVNPDSYLFTTDKGNQLNKRTLQKAFKRCIRKAGLSENYSIHSLRHTYATHLLKASNYNLRLVQKQLGHSSIKITEVYLSLIDKDVRDAVENLYKG